MIDEVVVGATVRVVLCDVVVSDGQLNLVSTRVVKRVRDYWPCARCVVIAKVPLPRDDFKVIGDRGAGGIKRYFFAGTGQMRDGLTAFNDGKGAFTRVAAAHFRHKATFTRSVGSKMQCQATGRVVF